MAQLEYKRESGFRAFVTPLLSALVIAALFGLAVLAADAVQEAGKMR